MSKSTPSLLALLGLVAIAGYQNRTRISEMLADAARADNTGPASQIGGFLSDVSQKLQNGLSGSGLSTALGDLVARLRTTGQQAAADSWISTEANRPINVDDLEAALGPDTLAELTQKTGFGRAELLLRLNASLPDVVNRLTPHGRLPNEDDVQTLV